MIKSAIMVVMQSLHAVTHCAVFQVTYLTSKVGVKTNESRRTETCLDQLGESDEQRNTSDELLKLSSPSRTVQDCL